MKYLKITVGIVFSVVVVTLLVTATLNGREAARRTQWRNTLKQVGLALHNYHDSYNCLPPGGIYSEYGQGYQGWPKRIALFQSQTPFSGWIDDRIPWNDPRQIEWFTTAHCRETYLWRDPSIELTEKNSFPLIHLAANSWVMHRNSHVTIADLNGSTQRFLAADASEPFDVYGSTTAWRNASLPLNSSPLGFSSHGRPMTHCLMGDGTVRPIDVDIDESIWKQMQGPETLRPAEELTDRVPVIPPRPTDFEKHLWAHMFHKDSQAATLSSDGKHLTLNSEAGDPSMQQERRQDAFEAWLVDLARFCSGGDIHSATMYRHPSPEEVAIILASKHLESVDICRIGNDEMIRPLIEKDPRPIQIEECPPPTPSPTVEKEVSGATDP